MQDTSPKYSLNEIDWKKHSFIMLQLVLGAILTQLSQIISNIDFGQYTPIVMLLWTGFINLAWRWARDNKPPAEPSKEEANV